jgi:RNA polymerase sigma-70 factor (sigma-E family)
MNISVQAADRGRSRLCVMDLAKSEPATGVTASGLPSRAGLVARDRDGAAAVTVLYHEHALGLMRLAHIMLGDKQAAEDVVQDAFLGLYRRWSHLADPAKALQYVRSSVLNGCRSARRRSTPVSVHAEPLPAASAEAAALSAEERDEVMTALRGLPARQREALVLRFFLDEPAAQIAEDMGISQSSVRSATARGLASLHRMLGGTP